MVTFAQGEPAWELTVFSDAEGQFRTPALGPDGAYGVRVRRIGWQDLRLDDQTPPGAEGLELVLERETDPAQLAAQLPANRWYQLVLERLDDPAQREELKRQCTYCHQQGNWATRRERTEDDWAKLIEMMARRGGMLSRELREALPAHLVAAYALEQAIPKLTARMHEPDFEPPPAPEVWRAVIEEWELGGRASMQHDMVVHPDGSIYSVDMAQDMLYRLDPRVPGGARQTWPVPQGDLPLGGTMTESGQAVVAEPTSNARVGPHSLQVAPDGSIWITLAHGDRLAGFDPSTEKWTVHELRWGIYPHTLRFDQRGRIWYTISATNHIGLYDPATGEGQQLRIPDASVSGAVMNRLMPLLIWGRSTFDWWPSGFWTTAPVPYGIDVDPDGNIWFSQLNQHTIGRVDPDTLEIEVIQTPFYGPRRLRIDSQGQLWIPSFSDGLISRFDPATREFRSWELPIDPRGTEVPYAVNIDAKDRVWICGTNSDTLIRFDPQTEAFTVVPMPTRVTYTREIDFDAQGRVWTSNSNSPAWQIEGGFPRVIRLDLDGSESASLSAGSE
jgi:streptogramin lyase